MACKPFCGAIERYRRIGKSLLREQAKTAPERGACFQRVAFSRSFKKFRCTFNMARFEFRQAKDHETVGRIRRTSCMTSCIFHVPQIEQ
ncbi:hypothetical protein WT54_28725 [Burkholderia territorii]|nr:hypothetical protein WT54_28725 [Burkholderia territorii]